jgi:hypothetical protein
MTLACALLLIGLGVDPAAGRDAGVPPWLPETKPVDVSAKAQYPLRQVRDGYLYTNPHFEARVGRDGLVSFKDKHGSVSFPFFERGARPRGPTLESALRDYLGKRRGREASPPPEPAPPPRGMVQSEICPPGSSCYFPPTANIIAVSGTFDLTDELMRGLGQDPYGPEKARFLSATFEFRIKLAIAARVAEMKQSLADLPARLDELWGNGRYSVRERRRILYELWYETDRSREGERAATIIREFIRRRLPCGGPDGYTQGELEAFAKSHPGRLLFPPGDCR